MSFCFVVLVLDGMETMDARLQVDERETTTIVLEIVEVAERNGLKLPREFGLLLKQVLTQFRNRYMGYSLVESECSVFPSLKVSFASNIICNHDSL